MNNFAALETLLCPVCGVEHSYGAGILINKKLRDIPKDQTYTGYGMCEEHAKLDDDGYIALVEGVKHTTASTAKPEDVHRSGRIMHMRRTVVEDMFNVDVSGSMIYVEPAVFNQITEMVGEES